MQLLAGCLRVWLKPELRIRIATFPAQAEQGPPGTLWSSQDRQRAWVAEWSRCGLSDGPHGSLVCHLFPHNVQMHIGSTAVKGRARGLSSLRQPSNSHHILRDAARTWVEGGSCPLLSASLINSVSDSVAYEVFVSSVTPLNRCPFYELFLSLSLGANFSTCQHKCLGFYWPLKH